MTANNGSFGSGATEAGGSPVGIAKRILYFAPGHSHLEDLLQGLALVPGCLADAHAAPPLFAYRSTHARLCCSFSAAEGMRRLHAGYFNLVIVDMRDLEGGYGGADKGQRRAFELLDAMAAEPDVEARFAFHRVLVLVSGPVSDQTDQLIASLGRRGVGRIIRDSSTGWLLQDVARGPRRVEFSKLVLDEALRMMLAHKRGKRALCASGGGITGMYFEMGALKCLDDCLLPDAVNTFDMYFGISAGAVVTAFLANGYSVDECMAAVAGVEGGRVPMSTLSLFQLRHLNFRDFGIRLGRVVRQMGASLRELVKGGFRPSLTSLILDYSDLVGPPFNTLKYEKTLQALFGSQGATNDFRKLVRPLYIGATDQDARTHVLFGDGGYDDVPISAAVQASISVNPAFASAKIRGRYYEDGAVTRTSNFKEAIHKGSDLLFILDPFVPYVSKEPGYTRDKGILYNIDQDIRTASYTRFETIRNAVLPHYPFVSSYTFLPANRLRKLMSINPMDHRPYLEIWRGAYLCTLRRILHIRYRMSGDLASHNIRLDASRAQEVAARLRASKSLTFADFFPGGRIELSLPPLCQQRAAAGTMPQYETAIPRAIAGPTAA